MYYTLNVLCAMGLRSPSANGSINKKK